MKKTDPKNKKIIAVIPARGGSKGILKKNIKPLSGKPLIAHTIEQALQSKYLDRVIVSTDDEEIARVSRCYKAEVPFFRPAKLAQDDSPTIDTIFHALDWFAERGDFFDIVALLEPTSPLRKDDDIDRALELFCSNFEQADALVSVGGVHLEHPSIMKKIEAGYVKPLGKSSTIYQRQQLTNVYFPYGVIYLSKVDSLREQKTFYQERTIPYLIERWQNYEIDDLDDFFCVEIMLKNHKII